MLLSRWQALTAHMCQARALASLASSTSSARAFASQPTPPPTSSPYAVLGVEKNAKPADLKAAFRREAMRLHPDRSGNGEAAAAAFIELAGAYEALSDPARRRAIDDAEENAGAGAASWSPPASSSASPSRAPPRQRQTATTAPYESPSYDERDMPPFLQRWFEQERRRRQRERDERLKAAAEAGTGRTKTPWPLSLAEAWFVGDDDNKTRSQQPPLESGPSALDPRSAEAVAGALARCRAALHDDLHSALMLAFFGPRAPRRGLPLGALPPAFEAEERADSRLTPDLLHLVSGRTLLGVVRERRPLLLTGGDDDGKEGGGALGEEGKEPEPMALPLFFVDEKDGGGDGDEKKTEEDPRAVLREVLGEEMGGGKDDNNDDAPSSSWTPDQEAEVLRRLDAPHALRGRYAWAPDLPAQVLLGGQKGSLLAMPPLAAPLSAAGLLVGGSSDPLAIAPSSSSSSSDAGAGAAVALAPSPLPPSSSEKEEEDEARRRHTILLGAARGRAAWDAAVAATGQRPLWADTDDKEDDNNPFMRPDEAELARRRARALAAAHASAERARKRRWRRLIKSPTADWRPEEWAFDDRSRGVTVLELALTPRGAEEEEGGEEGGGAGAGVIAVGVRHEDPWALHELGLQRHDATTRRRQRSSSSGDGDDDQTTWQRGKFGGLAAGILGTIKAPLPAHACFPLKIYVGGRFVAAALDDVLMEPHTGDLMAAVYRMSSPGVNHIWCLRPQKPAPRLLARMKRGTLPPSATWLFPPRAPGTHDVGGWYVEAERAQTAEMSTGFLKRPGHIHPAVFVMVAAFASLDAERRREEKARERAWLTEGVARVGRMVRPLVAPLVGRWQSSLQQV